MLTRSDLTRGPNLKAPRKLHKLRDFNPIDVAEAWGLCYHLGCVIHYVSRSTLKGESLEDLKIAEWYLKRKMEIGYSDFLRKQEDGIVLPEAIAKDWNLSSHLESFLISLYLAQRRENGASTHILKALNFLQLAILHFNDSQNFKASGTKIKKKRGRKGQLSSCLSVNGLTI